MKRPIEMSWKIIPATMMCVADKVGEPLEDCCEACAPPTAWRMRDTKSAVMKMMKYHMGWRMENWGPSRVMAMPRTA